MNGKKTLLVILDGWGHGQNPEVSAIAQAETPFVDSLYKKYPNSELVTYGEQVGLPEGQMGNSEVGHLNIGAGRIVYQELARINKSVKEGTLAKNEVLRQGLEYAKLNNRAVHLLGLVSDGGVHSHINHLKALCDITNDYGLQKVFIHAFTDGRDTAPKSGIGYLKQIEKHIKHQSAKLASVIGRYYAMDRDNRWERIKLAYDLLVRGKGEKTTNILKTVKERYEAGETDEFFKPIIRTFRRKPIGLIQQGDVVIFFNFRTDRPREITEALTQKDFPYYDMQKLSLKFITMNRYDENFAGVDVLFKKDNIKNTLGEVLQKNKKTQVRIAETEKYPHVTFFFNGGREEEFDGEHRILIPSPKVDTYDLQPEMSAIEATDKLLKYVTLHQPDFICFNYANADMVGHTGVFSAAKIAAETVDNCLRRLIDVVLEYNYETLIIADHGNSDYMINPDGSPHTAHTTNPVPFIYVSKHAKKHQVKNGKLGDIAPTILNLMGIAIPEEMKGEILIE